MLSDAALKTAKAHSLTNADPGRDILWTHVNVGEAVPGVVTPLTAAFWHNSHTNVPRLMYHELGILKSAEIHAPFTPRTTPVQFVHGRMAANVDFLRFMADRLPGTSGAALEEQMLGSVRADAAVTQDRSRYPVIALSLLKILLAMPACVHKLHDRTMARWRNHAAHMARADYETARATFEWEITKGQEDVIGTHGLTALLSPLVWEPLAKMVRRVGSEDDVLAMSAGMGGVEEAQMMQALWQLAQSGDGLNGFLRRYGYMGPDSGELASKPWRLDPRSLNTAAQAFASKQASPNDGQQAAHQTMLATKARILKLLPLWRRPLFRLTHWLCKTYLPLREVGKASMIAHADIGRLAALCMGQHLHAAGAIDQPEDIFYLIPDELPDNLAQIGTLQQTVARRKQTRAIYQQLDIPDSYTGRDIPHFWNALEHHGNAVAAREQVSTLQGLGVARGTAEGIARVIYSADDFEQFKAGEILVCKSTDPGWAPVFSIAAAMVVDIGGMLSHSAIIARELGVPAIVNTRNGTRALRTGQRLRINGDSGLVEVLSEAPQTSENTAAPAAPHDAPIGPAIDPRSFADTHVPQRWPQMGKPGGFTDHIVPLQSATDETLFGGKAAALCRAISANLPVPDGFALSWQAVETLDTTIISALVDRISGPVAVRSSGIGEDGQDASFAGQHETVLGVCGTADILAAIQTVAASRLANHVSHYRGAMGEQDAAPRMAIVVQALVPSQRAGVMFTHNPVTGEPQRVVEAAWGLGEVVVGGLVTPDHYVLDAQSGAITEHTVGNKNLVMFRDQDGNTAIHPVEDDAASALCLTAPDCEALNQLAQDCLAAFGGPQDIEWAFAGDTLYLLQSRPITKLGA